MSIDRPGAAEAVLKATQFTKRCSAAVPVVYGAVISADARRYPRNVKGFDIYVQRQNRTDGSSEGVAV